MFLGVHLSREINARIDSYFHSCSLLVNSAAKVRIFFKISGNCTKKVTTSQKTVAKNHENVHSCPQITVFRGGYATDIM